MQHLPKHLVEQAFIIVNYPSQGPLPNFALVGKRSKGLVSCPLEWIKATMHQCEDEDYPLDFLSLTMAAECASAYFVYLVNPPSTLRRSTHGSLELRKGQIPVIVRANRTLIRLDPVTNSLLEMPRPEPLDDGQPWNGVDLRAFGPSFAAITGDGDGKDSSLPLPPVETKADRSTRSKQPRSPKGSKKGGSVFTHAATRLTIICPSCVL
jgi:hypothetical protein